MEQLQTKQEIAQTSIPQVQQLSKEQSLPPQRKLPEKIYRSRIEGIAPLICKDSINLEPNPILVRTVPYQWTFDEQAGDSIVVVPAGGTVSRVMTNDYAGPVMVKYLMGLATNQNLLINILDNQYGSYMMNQPIYYGTIIGTGNFPFELSDYLFVTRSQILRYDLTDLSLAPNTVRLVNDSFRLYFPAEETLFNRLSEANKISRNYFYTTDQQVTLVVSAAIQSFFITFINVADFMWNRTTFISDGAFRARIVNVATGITYTNGWIHSSMFGGNAQNYKDFEAMFICRGSQLRIDFVNLSLLPNRVFLTLTGMNYYYDRRSQV